MRRRWIRVAATPADDLRSALAAAAVAVGVGAAAFYLVRLLLAREPLGAVPAPTVERASSGPDGDS